MTFFGTRILSVGNHYEAPFIGHYKNSYYALMAQRMRRKFCLPPEVTDIIFESAGHIVWVEVSNTRTPKRSVPRLSIGEATASRPPADGSCPFIDRLPAEIRRKILVDELDSLPSKHQTISPTCGTVVSRALTRRNTANLLVKLMLISKKIRDEVAEIVYEERTFGIHVHQGFENAGIEFLNVGRQPLQYLDHINDGRFIKFRPDSMFGFCRLKRIEVNIFPYDGTYHHTIINTYFMNIALVRLLHRSTMKEVDRITSIRITFPEGDLLKHTSQNAVLAAGSSWWDAEKDRPRESSIHGISDVELILRPFAQLSHVHNVDVRLPTVVDRHVRTVKFVETLQRYMTSKVMQMPTNSDDLERKIESARCAHEDYVRKSMFGGTGTEVPQITDRELEDEKRSQNSDDEDEDDMDAAQEVASLEDQHDSSEHDDDLTRMHSSRCAIEHAVFDEDGGFLDDHDPLDDDIPITPNETSEKVAVFVECFQVTGDVARSYLALGEDDLERASHLFIAMPDAREAAAAVSKLPPVSEGPVTPNHKHGESSHVEPDISNKDNKGKGRALIVIDDDEDMSDGHGHVIDDEGPSQLKQIAHLRRFQQGVTRAKVQNSQQSQGHVYRDEEVSIPSQSHDFPPQPTTFGIFGSNRGGPASSNTSSGTSSTYMIPSDLSGVFGPQRTVVRRDSSVGLATTYSQQQHESMPARGSEYRPYTSPPSSARTGSAQTAVNMRQDLNNGRLTFKQRQRDYSSSHVTSSSPSHGPFPRRSLFLAADVPSVSDYQRWQPQAYASSNALQGSLPYSQTMYRDPLRDGWSQDIFATAGPSSETHPCFTSDSQQPVMTQTNSTVSGFAPWAGGSYYTNHDNVTMPIPAPYPSSSAPSTDQTLNDGLPLIDTSPLFLRGFAPSVPLSPRNYDDAFANQSYRTSTRADAENNVTMPPTQRSGLGANLEGQGVDIAEDSPPGAVPVDTEQMQDSDF